MVRARRAVGRRGAGDWRERFIRAYDAEFQDWIDAVAAGAATGPSAWDGYAATVVTDACLEAMRTAARVRSSHGRRPASTRPSWR